jgi:hypothetical protein
MQMSMFGTVGFLEHGSCVASYSGQASRLRANSSRICSRCRAVVQTGRIPLVDARTCYYISHYRMQNKTQADICLCAQHDFALAPPCEYFLLITF